MSVADDNYLSGLLAERAKLVELGRYWHVALVDDELVRVGHTPPQAPPPTVRLQPEERVLERADQKASENAAAPRPETQHGCGVCGRTFRTPAALGSHSRVHR